MLKKLLLKTPLQYLPVTVRRGIAKGAKWTLFPHSSYWRRGGNELDIESAIELFGDLTGRNCWDLGAHFGIYTVGMALAVGASGQVASFEPDRVSFARCKRHVEMNDLPWVKLFHAAVSDKEGDTTLILSQGLGATTSHLAYEREVADHQTETDRVRSLMLDALVESGQVRPPALVKIDVEGHGGQALKGFQKTIAKYKPFLIMSFHSPEELKSAREVLEPLAYQVVSCGGIPVRWEEALYRTVILRDAGSGAR